MKERLIIVFVAVAIGLIVTTAAFFIYQSTKSINKESATKNKAKINTVGRTNGKLYLTIDEPKDEAVFSTRTIQLKGRTNAENTLIVSSNQEDVVASPTDDGTYAITLNIDVGTNKIIVKAVAPDGSEIEETKVVSFSTEEF